MARFALKVAAVDCAPQWRGLGRDFFSGDTIARSEAGVGGPREYLWGLAWQYIRESLLVGIGPMHYAHRVNVEAAHPHNVYLQLAAEWGVPFALVAVGLAVAGWVRLLRVAQTSADDAGRAIGIGLVAVGVTVAVDGMFSGNFVMPMSQLWIAFAIGLAIAYVRTAGAPATTSLPAPASLHLRWAVVAMIVFGQIAIWQGVWPEILDVNAHVDRVRAQIVHNVVDNPRIWSHGGCGSAHGGRRCWRSAPYSSPRAMPRRARDWLRQAERDLEQSRDSRLACGRDSSPAARNDNWRLRLGMTKGCCGSE